MGQDRQEDKSEQNQKIDQINRSEEREGLVQKIRFLEEQLTTNRKKLQEMTDTSKDLSEANKNLATANREMSKANHQLTEANERLADANYKLTHSDPNKNRQ